jgi:hypothetical protein
MEDAVGLDCKGDNDVLIGPQDDTCVRSEARIVVDIRLSRVNSGGNRIARCCAQGLCICVLG